MDIRQYLKQGRLNIDRIVTGPIEQNTWLIAIGTDLIVVDPGCDQGELRQAIADRHLLGVLLTHTHDDHLAALRDWDLPEGTHLVMGPEPEDTYLPLLPNKIVHGGERLKLGPIEVHVMATPGHTPGGISYLIDRRFVCTGDTLFQGDVGYHHLPGGDADQLRWSVTEVLFKLQDSVAVLPGHGEPSTIGHEKQHNTLQPT